MVAIRLTIMTSATELRISQELITIVAATPFGVTVAVIEYDEDARASKFADDDVKDLQGSACL